MENSPAEVTELLHSWMAGDRDALERIVELVYPQLHQIAHRQMSKERAGHVLQTTALINEAYLRLMKIRHMSWKDRVHFRAVSARIMRRILVEASRRDRHKVPIPDDLKSSGTLNFDALMLDQALTKLAELDPRKAQVAEMKYFGDMTAEESAGVLGVSVQTVNNDRSLAKAWLLRELSGRAAENAAGE
ncbi:MAG: sigma-70 family RNA polymerase sigma factor [Acidobacteriaceae bacterium]|nr:sigma-70 family RNA polymerase sigma factor [Acidobacteriaceae bacterium]